MSWYLTTYEQLFVVWLPALSDPVSVLDFTPTVATSVPVTLALTGELPGPERLSVTTAVTLTLCAPAKTKDRDAPQVSAGAVLSTLRVRDAVPALPLRSAQIALSPIAGPSPEDVLDVVQLPESIPVPPLSSDQFQVTVTSLLFHPPAFAAGDWVGEEVGAVVSLGPDTCLSPS